MKKRIICYSILIILVIGIIVCNYSSVQKCNDIKITSITNNGEHIVIEGSLKGNFRSVKSIKTEKIGDSFYIKIEAVNDFFGAKPEFSVYIPNKKNNVEKVYLADKDTSTEIFLNSNFQKADN